MSSTIVTSVVTGGSNSHATTVAEINAFRSDFASPGVTGTIVLNSGSGGTGSFAVNAQSSPAMFVDVSAGSCYITATPSGQVSQLLRANMTATYTSYAISSNSSGSTKYDWVYLSVDATKANNPASAADDVTALYTSRSSSNTTDNGSPPTYGTLLAIVTVANGASSITNSNITDKRTNASLSTVKTSTYFFDFVELGCVWSGDSYASTLNASMTAGYIWISGVRLRVSAVSARAFTASKDTYVDLSDNGDGTAAFTYTPVTNNTASPVLASNSIRVGVIVTGASTIAAAASINQGQEDRVLPIASSIPYAVTDSLGNLICPRDPNRKILGYRQSIANQSSLTSTDTLVTTLSVPVIVPTGRKIKVDVLLPAPTAASGFCTLSIYNSATVTGTAVQKTFATMTAVSLGMKVSFTVTPSAASQSFCVAVSFSANGGATNHSTNTIGLIQVELA